MRIVYVTANLPHGTDEAFLLPEIAALTRLGHEILVVPRSPEGDIVHGSVLLHSSRREPLHSWEVLRVAASSAATRFRRFTHAIDPIRESRSFHIGLKNAAVVPKAAWLASIATEWGAGHIHCHWGATTATLAMIASDMSGIPWSVTLHRWDIVEDNLLAVKARSAALMRFISEDGLRMAHERGVPSADRIRVIRMGVDMPPALPRPRPAGRIVLCPARLVEVKGHRFLLEAWRSIRAANIDAELWLAGGGPLRHRLEAQAGNLGIRNSIRFLGTIPHNRLLEMYEKFGIACTVLPSVDLGHGCHEGIPVALIEAMSYGVPVVATRTGGTGELVVGGTGLLVQPGNPAELANAIRSLLIDPAGAQRLGEFGRRHVAREYDVRHIAGELVRWFETGRSGVAREATAFATP